MRFGALVVLIGTASLLAACDTKSEESVPAPTGTNGAPSATTPAPSTTGGVTGALEGMQTTATDTFVKLRDQAVATLEPRLEQAKAQFETYKGKITSLPEMIRPTVESTMTELDKQFNAAGEQLTRLKSATADNWQSISTELGATLDKITTSIKDLSARFPA